MKHSVTHPATHSYFSLSGLFILFAFFIPSAKAHKYKVTYNGDEEAAIVHTQGATRSFALDGTEATDASIITEGSTTDVPTVQIIIPGLGDEPVVRNIDVLTPSMISSMTAHPQSSSTHFHVTGTPDFPVHGGSIPPVFTGLQRVEIDKANSHIVFDTAFALDSLGLEVFAENRLPVRLTIRLDGHFVRLDILPRDTIPETSEVTDGAIPEKELSTIEFLSEFHPPPVAQIFPEEEALHAVWEMVTVALMVADTALDPN